MKKAFTQTIIVFVAVNLITAGFAIAQNAPDEASREEAIAAQKEAEAARKQQLEAEIKQIQAQLLKQLLAKQKQVELQIPEIPEIEVAVPRISLLGYSGGGGVLVVPAAELKGEDLTAITEDMSVMSRIFANKLSQARLTTGRGGRYGDYMYGGRYGDYMYEDYNPFLRRDSGTIEAIYLEGYAALFLMKVNFPLSPSPETQEEKKTEEEDTDPLWTQMRQEIYAPEEADRRLRRPRTDRPEEKYDAEKVEKLKETLIKTLKHAVNIRALKPDQSVILTVIGGRSQSGTRTVTRLYSYLRDSRIVRTEPGAETGFSSPTVLTIRAKKADIDAFANGTLSFDQFSQKILLLSYSYLGENVGGPSRSSPPNMMYGGSSRNRPR